MAKLTPLENEMLDALEKLLRTALDELRDADHALGVYEARRAISKAKEQANG